MERGMQALFSKGKSMNKLIPAMAGMAMLMIPGFAQSRRATFLGGGNPDEGKCTVEVVVDGAADVRIDGNTATLHNLSGGRPQWRRFECTGPLPSNPANFRFQGVDGRGRQTLIRDPRNGGPAVIRLEDPDGGSEGYTFDIFWQGGGGPGYGRGDGPGYGRGDGRVDRPGPGPGPGPSRSL